MHPRWRTGHHSRTVLDPYEVLIGRERGREGVGALSDFFLQLIAHMSVHLSARVTASSERVPDALPDALPVGPRVCLPVRNVIMSCVLLLLDQRLG